MFGTISVICIVIRSLDFAFVNVHVFLHLSVYSRYAMFPFHFSIDVSFYLPCYVFFTTSMLFDMHDIVLFIFSIPVECIPFENIRQNFLW